MLKLESASNQPTHESRRQLTQSDVTVEGSVSTTRHENLWHCSLSPKRCEWARYIGHRCVLMMNVTRLRQPLILVCRHQTITNNVTRVAFHARTCRCLINPQRFLKTPKNQNDSTV